MIGKEKNVMRDGSDSFLSGLPRVPIRRELKMNSVVVGHVAIDRRFPDEEGTFFD